MFTPKQLSVTLFNYLTCSCRGKSFMHCALSLSLLSHALWICSKVNIPFVYLSCSVLFLCRLCTEASVPGARLIFDALLWSLIRVRNGRVDGMRVTSGEKNMGWKKTKKPSLPPSVFILFFRKCIHLSPAVFSESDWRSAWFACSLQCLGVRVHSLILHNRPERNRAELLAER